MTHPAYAVARNISGPPLLVEPIADRQASGSAEIVIAWTGDYDAVMVDLWNVRPVTDSVQLRAELSGDGGATFDTGVSDYQFRHVAWLAAQTNIVGPGAYLPMCTVGGVGNAAEENAQWSLILPRPFDTGIKTQIIGSGGQQGSTGNPASLALFGYRDAAGRVDAIRFFLESGNIAEGRFTATGLRKG